MTTHPPRPRLAVAVGIIGHRPNRLPENARTTVAAEVKEALAGIARAAEEARQRHRQFFSEEPPMLRLLSALAEGADRMAAVAALELGWPLAAVLPFAAGDYERDFAEASSRAEFADLLKRAERTLELPGSRAQEKAGYEGAGETILENADILLAVWDGGASAGRGGTTELVERCARTDMPILHVDAKGEQPPRVLWSGLADFPAPGADLSELPSDVASALPGVVDALVRPPGDQAERDKAIRYFGETWKPRNWRIEVPLLLSMLRLRPLRRTDSRPKQPAALAAEMEHQLRVLNEAGADRPAQDEIARTALAFGWADALGIRYAQIFRGAYSSNFLAAALAVVAGTASLVGTALLGWSSTPLTVVEVALLVFIGINTWIGRKRDWHNRWRESREVAERFRAAVPLWQVARTPGASPAAQSTWTSWYVRAQLRALGMVAGVLDKSRLEGIRQDLIAIVDDQCAYHTHVAGLMRGVEVRIERVGLVLFGLAFLFGALSIVTAVMGFSMPLEWDYVLTGLAAALPALGAATFGIRLIGDFEGIAQRSDHTGALLAGLGAALRQDAPSLAVLRPRARALADAMLGDVAHWRMTTETRKLFVPG